MPGNIFLNYRRDDTAGHAGRLFDRLNHRFPGRVFRDVDGIAYGLDFVEEIERKLASCQVLIVLIGKHWLTLKVEGGGRRIDDENDFVRLEVATGLRRKIRVIPVLVHGASMPRAAELPDDLKPLAKRNALEVTEPDFDNDAARLIRTLEEALGEQPARAAQEPRTPPDRKKSRVALFVGLGAAALIALVVAVLALTRTSGTNPTSEARLAPNLTSTPDSKTFMSPSPPANAVAKMSPSPTVNGAANTKRAEPTPTPATRAPAPTDEMESEPEQVVAKPFSPTGRWLVTARHSDTVLYVLKLDDSAQFEIEGSPIRGVWTYDESEQKLILIAKENSGRLVSWMLVIGDEHQGHYHIKQITQDDKTTPGDMKRG